MSYPDKVGENVGVCLRRLSREIIAQIKQALKDGKPVFLSRKSRDVQPR